MRLKSAIKSVNNPNITRGDIEKILIGAQEYSALNDKFGKLRSQLSTFAGLITSQFNGLRSQGIRFEHESNLFELLKG